jgi:hypothetical protein
MMRRIDRAILGLSPSQSQSQARASVRQSRHHDDRSPRPGSPSTNANGRSNGVKQPTTSSITVASVDDLSRTHGEVEVPDEAPDTRCFSWRTLWMYTGPGWLMSIAYLDPGNLEADLQAGAFVGYELICMPSFHMLFTTKSMMID